MLVSMTESKYYAQPDTVDLYGGSVPFKTLAQVQRRLELLDAGEKPVRVTVKRMGGMWIVEEYCMIGRGIKLN